MTADTAYRTLTDVTDEPEPAPDAPPTIPAPKNRVFWLSIFLLVVALALVIKGYAGMDDNGPPVAAGVPASPEMTAYEACENWVTDLLKAPATADFPGYTGSTVTTTGDRYRVSSYVDSQNSFGATIRTNFTCTVEHRGPRYWVVGLTGL